MNSRDYIYDKETYPNIITFRATHAKTGKKYCFEISDRRDDRQQLFAFLDYLHVRKQRMVGFNNIWFDWEVLQWFYEHQHATVAQIYAKAMSRITAARNDYPMWAGKRYVEQIDLLKINHFDNKAKATSLKALEIAMRMNSVQDLPFPVGTVLADWQKDMLLSYNEHDVDATLDFYVKCYEAIEFREELSKTYEKDFMNFPDTKIGEQIFITLLEKRGVECYTFDNNNKRVPRQTIRPFINLGECIFPYVRCEHPAFQMVQNYLAAQVITETKGVFSDIICTPQMVQYMDPKLVKVWLKGTNKPRRLCHLPQGTDFTDAKFMAANLHCHINGFTYVFGTGGLHASLKRRVIRSTQHKKVRDRDVASFYPNLGIKNRVFPAHLSSVFCEVYDFMFHERLRVGKKTKMGDTYKLALNGTYGNSNNEHSPFYDPMYTMKITINGQLLLCMLVEQLIKVPGLEMIQCNTDGITYHCPVEYLEHVENICQWWQAFTCLELEEANYSAMFIRDVNNYRAEYENGDVKLKGAYEIKRQWHKDQSALVVQKAVDAAMGKGVPVQNFIFAHLDPYDFMIKGKVNRDCNLILRNDDGTERQTSNTIRYYLAKEGGHLVKQQKPKGKPGTYKRANKLTDEYYNAVVASLRGTGDPKTWDADEVPHDPRIHTKNKSRWALVTETGLQAGSLISECSNSADFNWKNLDYFWYIAEANKLMIKE